MLEILYVVIGTFLGILGGAFVGFLLGKSLTTKQQVEEILGKIFSTDKNEFYVIDFSKDSIKLCKGRLVKENIKQSKSKDGKLVKNKSKEYDITYIELIDANGEVIGRKYLYDVKARYTMDMDLPLVGKSCNVLIYYEGVPISIDFLEIYYDLKKTLEDLKKTNRDKKEKELLANILNKLVILKERLEQFILVAGGWEQAHVLKLKSYIHGMEDALKNIFQMFPGWLPWVVVGAGLLTIVAVVAGGYIAFDNISKVNAEKSQVEKYLGICKGQLLSHGIQPLWETQEDNNKNNNALVQSTTKWVSSVANQSQKQAQQTVKKEDMNK